MNDPFYNLYDIIYCTSLLSNKKVLQCYFPKFGENDPKKLIFKEPADGKNRFLYRYLMLHDQEPVFYEKYKEDWDTAIYLFNRIETNHIFSNSEKNSKDKNELLKKSGWHDFYWFSNGFMSLEWYRFYRYASYLENMWSPTKTFSSYNRIFDDRNHRLHIAQFLYRNFPNDIILSCHFNEKNNNYNDLFINTINKKNQNLSYTIDTNDFIDSFCHITTERIFYEDRIHLTEKIFRPIVCCRPFILVSSPKSLAYLKDYGFKTFNDFWSEDYDNILDHNNRLSTILELINQIGNYSKKQIYEMLNEMKEILIFNRNYFYNNFSDIITAELHNNLYSALSKNNNQLGWFQKILNNLNEKELNLLHNCKTCASDDEYFREIFLNAVNLKQSNNNQIRPFVKNNLDYFKLYHKKLNELD